MMVTLSKTTTTTAEGRQTLDLQTDLASIAAHRKLVEAIMHHPHRATATATAAITATSNGVAGGLTNSR